MLASDQAVSELALPAPDLRRLVRRGAVPAALLVVGVGIVMLSGGPLHAFAAALRRGLDASPTWAAAGVGFEALSLTGYVVLLSLVAGRATPRIGPRESAQITLAGAAATRLLPTAGAGGAALAVWALRRAGLKPLAAARTLLAFMVLLYSVFLGAIAIAGAALGLGLVAGRGPVALSAVPAAAAVLAIAVCLGLAWRHPVPTGATRADRPGRRARHGARLASAARVMGHAVRDAISLTGSGDPRLLGAIAYWLFDAAVLWSMLHAFGTPPALLVVLLAYLIGQVANTIPIPGSVSGGMVGVLLAFGVSAELAVPAVLVYRLISVWIPVPAAVAAVPGLRVTVARWAREDAAALGADPAGSDGVNQRSVVAGVLVGVGDGELPEALVEPAPLADVGGDGDRIAGAGVGAGQHAPARGGELAPGAARSAPRSGSPSCRGTGARRSRLPADRGPAGEDVGRALDQALADHHPLAVVGVPARLAVCLVHRRSGLLDLQKQRVGAAAPLEQDEEHAHADAAHADDLAGGVDEREAVEQVTPVLRQRSAGRPRTPRRAGPVVRRGEPAPAGPR